jgi:hypothetical protein
MKDRIEEIFQQVMDEACPDPLRRFAELVAEDAVEKEREDCLAIVETHPTVLAMSIAIRKRGEK